MKDVQKAGNSNSQTQNNQSKQTGSTPKKNSFLIKKTFPKNK